MNQKIYNQTIRNIQDLPHIDTIDPNFIKNWISDSYNHLVECCNYEDATKQQSVSLYDEATDPAVLISNHSGKGPITVAITLDSLDDELKNDPDLLDFTSMRIDFQLHLINHYYRCLTDPQTTQRALIDALDFVSKDD